MSRVSLIIFTVFLTLPGFCQQQDTLLEFPHHMISKNTDQGVKLRWAPKSKKDLLSLRDQTINILRAEIVNGRPNEYKLIANNIAPISEVELTDLLGDQPTNKAALTVAYALYSEWETQLPNSNSKQNWALASDELDSRYLALLYACDRSFITAEMAGLGYLDKTAQSGKNYAYRFTIDGGKYLMAHQVVETKIDNGHKLEIDRWEEGEGKVTIAWNRRLNDRHFSGYYIERSGDGKSFERLNKQPYVHALSDNVEDVEYMAFIDSVENYIPYHYRIIGLDAFGDESTPSKSIKLFGRDRTPPAPPIANPISMSDDQTTMNITWTYENDLEEISKFLIKKSNAIDGKFSIIAEVPKSEFSYSDSSPSLLVDQYYQVCAVDTAENFSCTYPKYGILKDKIPPAPPENVIGSIDSNGVVKIRWDIGKEIDLYGYKVHVANAPNRPFSPISTKPLRALEYSDTINLKTMTEFIYYRVSAVDLRQNVSEYSKVLRLKKPDIVPPSAPVFSKFEVKKEEIYFEFRPSQSADIDHHEIERSTDGINFKFHAHIDKGIRSFTDNNISSETTYWYNLTAVDDDGNVTNSPKTIKLRSLNPNEKQKVVLEGEKTDKGFLLKWDTQEDIAKTRIYRTIGEKFITYHIQENSESEFLDDGYVDQNYKIKVYFKDGSSSTISEPLFAIKAN